MCPLLEVTLDTTLLRHALVPVLALVALMSTVMASAQAFAAITANKAEAIVDGMCVLASITHLKESAPQAARITSG